MASNRLLPYRDLQTRHLRMLLGTSRVIAWIGMLLIAGGIAYAITAVYQHFTQPPGMFAAMAMSLVIGLIGYGLIALALSGVLAALIGIEESQRRRVEKD